MRAWKHTLLWGAITIALVGVIIMGFMSIRKEVVIFSDLSGTVTENGKPVSGAEVSRSVVWKDKTIVEKASTGEDGAFSFPAMKKKSVLANLPGEVVIPQEIWVGHNGKRTRVYLFIKRDIHLNGEIGRALRLKCELTNEEKNREGIYGVCVPE